MANEGSSSSEYTMVRKDVVLACCICSICSQIIRNPTTIIECLHIFCYQCIHDKIVKEKWQNCPKCYKFIGPNPLSKIRPNPLKMSVRDPLSEHGHQENPKHKVIEESSSSSTVVALDLGLGLGASNVPQAQTGCSKQGEGKGKDKGKAPQKIVRNFDLNFAPPQESPTRPDTIVLALPSQHVNTKRSRSHRSP